MNKIKEFFEDNKVEIFVTCGALTIFTVGTVIGFKAGSSLGKGIQSAFLDTIVELIEKDGEACVGLTLDTGKQILAKFVFG